MKQNVVVTGAGGYIGGQTAIALNNAGYNVIGIDKVQPKNLKQYFYAWASCDFKTVETGSVLRQYQPIAVVHCAGTSLVGPSVKDPADYYENNFIGTKKLADTIIKHLPNCHLIVSSSAAVYGEPVLTPCSEEDPPLPLSPYGESKLMVEMMLKSYAVAYNLKYTAFRYFNVCGADSKQQHGQQKQATHILARILEAIKDKTLFTLNGDDYPTADGTCIRDYVHVEDIALAHILAIKHNTTGVYNLGTGSGYSNLDIINTALQVTNQQPEGIIVGTAREGDPAVLTCKADKFANATGWGKTTPLKDLDTMIHSAWTWYTRGL